MKRPVHAAAPLASPSGHCLTLMSFCCDLLEQPIPFYFKGPSVLRNSTTTQPSWPQPWWQKWPPRVRHGATRWAFCHQTRSRTVLDVELLEKKMSGTQSARHSHETRPCFKGGQVGPPALSQTSQPSLE